MLYSSSSFSHLSGLNSRSFLDLFEGTYWEEQKIEKFKNEKFNKNDHDTVRIQESLTEIYSEMRSRQLACIQKAGSFRSDPFFSYSICNSDNEDIESKEEAKHAPKEDSRRCFAISSIIDRQHSEHCEWSPAYEELQATLQDLPGLRFVDNADSYNDHECIGQLHWTLMQLVGFADHENEFPGEKNSSCPYLTSEYLNCVQDSLMVGGMDCAITIRFVGVIAVSTGLLMVGIPSLDINSARDTLRQRLEEKNLPLLEPFVNDIVHSTLFRVVSIESDDDDSSREGDDISKDLHDQLIQISKKYENVDLGNVTLNRFQIGPASWRMLSSELNQTRPSKEWTLPSTRRKPKYVHNSKELCYQDSCHTISAGSGAKLAQEIRMRLAATK